MSEQNAQVTQADREAALPFVGVNFTPGMLYSDAYRIGAGELDEHPLVQAFARHRTRAEPDLVEQCARIAERHAAPEGVPQLDYDRACRDIAASIRSALSRAESEGGGA